MLMPSLGEFLKTTSHEEIEDLRAKNAPAKWDKPHPHGMVVTSACGAYIEGTVVRDGKTIPVRVVDGHGQILCNSGGYGNPEIAANRELMVGKGVDAFSGNFSAAVVEWTRTILLESLGPWADKFKALFVTSGTEANDVLRRTAYNLGGGHAEIINLRAGYSGAGFAANAACGNPGWKGTSTPTIPGMHFVDHTPESLQRVLFDIPKGRSVSGMFEAGNFGVGGFMDVGDTFLRMLIDEVRKRNGSAFPDEVQTGIGRTGTTFWASQRIFEGFDIPPAGMSLAKGVGGNHRAAAVLLRKDVADRLDGLTYHTFAQNWQDLAAMGTVLQMAQRDDWTENARLRGEQLANGFRDMVAPDSVLEFTTHGRGLMFAVDVGRAEFVKAIITRAPLDGWICGVGGVKGNILRIAPRINSTQHEITELIEGARRTFSSDEVLRTKEDCVGL